MLLHLYLLLAPLLATVDASNGSASRRPSDEQSIEESVDFRALQGRSSNRFRAAGGSTWATLTAEATDRSIQLHWVRERRRGERLPDRSYASETLACSFHPTAVEPLSEHRIAVAGVDLASEQVLVEIWEITPARVDLVESLEVPGLLVQALAPQTHGTRTRVLTRAWKPGGVISILQQLQGAENALIVQTWGDKSLHSLHWSGESSRLELLATVRPTPGAIYLPELESPDYSSAWRADHRDLGFVIVLSDSGCLNMLRPIVLIDRDRDGRIDSHLLQPTWSPDYHVRMHDPERYLRTQGEWE